MSGLIEGRQLKRSNKDLGRVLALAFLATREDEDALDAWPDAWDAALKKCFPGERAALCASAGSGLRRLLESPADMAEASHCCAFGLLSSFRLMQEQLRIAGRRLVQSAIEPLEAMGKKSTPPR